MTDVVSQICNELERKEWEFLGCEPEANKPEIYVIGKKTSRKNFGKLFAFNWKGCH